MSGIAGVIRFDGGPIEPGLIETMTESMAHRGPDGLNTWSRGSVALGHCMLRTTPESLEESQPLANEDESVVLVMDGRVDNWEELRAELRARGARLRTRADAELVLRAYEAWGRDCVHHMDGDFALVIWDGQRQEAFCARDPMGHKPFHYHWDGKCLAIASELHAILALPWVQEEVNEGMIAERLASELVSLDETFWKGVWRLPPANRMKVTVGGTEIERYWFPTLDGQLVHKCEGDYVEHYRSLLEDVVRRQSRATGPLAAEVSGGLDSSAIFAIADLLRRHGQLRAPSIDAYTLHFEGGGAGVDLDFARAVCAHLNRPLNEIEPARRSLDWYGDRARRYRDFPGYPNGTMHLSIHEAAIQNGSRVILTGTGGDQMLFGDRRYYAKAIVTGNWRELLHCIVLDARTHGWRVAIHFCARYGIFSLLPNWARQAIKRAMGHCLRGGAGGFKKLSEPFEDLLRNRLNSGDVFDSRLSSRIYNEKLRYILGGDHVFALELNERLASSSGLEIRSPMNTKKLVEFSFMVPQYLLFQQNWNKYVHRKTLEDLLPYSVCWRRYRAEFSTVFNQHRAELRQILERNSDTIFSAWVSQECLAQLRSGTSVELSGGNAWRFWRLFGCLAVAHDGIRW